ncbi:C40 family peptidase [Flavobacterium zepuense]|nr:C40 family peptidase [Flavobacterium zepuense]
MIAAKYQWVAQIPDLPKMVAEAFRLGKLNTTEIPGAKSNPVIMSLAKEAEVANIFTGDEVAWCAVAHTVLALRADKPVLFKGYARLRAASFLEFGQMISVPCLGDTLVFKREGGYHVGLYIGEDTTHYHVAGGNQSNQYNITRIDKKRLLQARRPYYTTGVPKSVKRLFLNATGEISKNEV